MTSPDQVDVIVIWQHKNVLQKEILQKIERSYMFKSIPTLEKFIKEEQEENTTSETPRVVVSLCHLTPYFTKFSFVLDVLSHTFPHIQNYKEWLGLWNLLFSLNLLEKVDVVSLVDRMENDFITMHPHPQDLVYMIHKYRSQPKLAPARMIWINTLIDVQMMNYRNMKPLVLLDKLDKLSGIGEAGETEYLRQGIMQEYVRDYLKNTQNGNWILKKTDVVSFPDWIVFTFSYIEVLRRIQDGTFFPYFRDCWLNAICS